MWGVIIAEHRRGPHGTLERTETFERQGNERMKKKFTKRLLSWVMAAAMVISMLPISAMASGTTTGPVAKIGETTYTSLDEAVEKAEEGSTIELLQDCELTKGFNKTLTFTGDGKISINKQLTSNGEGWMCFGLYDPSRVLTFDGPGVEVEWTSDGSAPWLMLSLSGTLNVTNGAKLTYNFDSRTTGTRNAIYMNAGSTINVTNGSTLQILGVGTGGNAGQGIQLDTAGTATVNVTGGSTFTIDGTNRGYVNSPTIYVNGSTFAVQNCTSNGSNGGTFTAIDSQITYENNNGHGLSAGNVTIQNSTLNCNNNAYYGLTYSGNMTMDSTSVINANGNGYGYTGGGLRAYGTSTVDAGAKINILNNKRNGMENYGTFNVAEGATVTVTGNNEPSTNGGGIYNGGTLVLPTDTTIMNNYAEQTGGGICNAGTVTIPNGVELYNNHAGNAGDDIFNRDGATINNLPDIDINTGWALDGAEDELDCNGESHMIDGWYDDAEGARWEAHAVDPSENHIEKYEGTTINGLKALKAAHGTDYKDKTSYPGLDKTIVVGDSEVKQDDVAAGDTVNFKLTSNVPDDLLNYILPDEVKDPEIVTPAAVNALVPIEERGQYNLTFHDQMNDAFINATTPVVTLDRAGTDNDVTLTAGTHYTYTTDTGDGCDFHIVMDLVALYNEGIITDADIENAIPIIVTYTATLNEDATAGEYDNTAWVTYETGESEEVTVTVDTYGIDIFKYDQAIGNKPEGGLGGAEFTLTKEGDSAYKEVLTTLEDGTVSLEGLDAGTYYLQETKAPEGYVCSDKVVTIIIPDQAGTDNMVNVNFANSQIPHTGGMGTTMFSIVGGALIATAGVIFVISRKKRARSAA